MRRRALRVKLILIDSDAGRASSVFAMPKFNAGLNLLMCSREPIEARCKLSQLDAAQTLHFLKAPPGNRLEALKGNRQGQHSIRINDQWRICFTWTAVGPGDVEIVDYH